jgi:hypothetical protein
MRASIAEKAQDALGQKKYDTYRRIGQSNGICLQSGGELDCLRQSSFQSRSEQFDRVGSRRP